MDHFALARHVFLKQLHVKSFYLCFSHNTETLSPNTTTDTLPKMERTSNRHLAILGALILLITSHERAPEQVTLIRLKRAFYDKFVLLREFGKSDSTHSDE